MTKKQIDLSKRFVYGSDTLVGKNCIRTNVRFSPEMSRFIEKLCHIHKVSKQDVIRTAVRLMKQEYYQDIEERAEETEELGVEEGFYEGS